jgi:hypothetical protein
VKEKNRKVFLTLQQPENDLRGFTNQLLYLLSYASLDQIEADDYLLITHPV